MGKTSLDVRVRVSLAKNPTENDESPYWMPYTHVLFDAHPGILPVADSSELHTVDEQETFLYDLERLGSKIFSFC